MRVATRIAVRASIGDKVGQPDAESKDSNPERPCTQIVCTLAPKYLYRDYFEAKVYAFWVHGPFGKRKGLSYQKRFRLSV